MICILCGSEHSRDGEYCQACLAAYRLRAGGNEIPFLRQQIKGQQAALDSAIKRRKATQPFRDEITRLLGEIAVKMGERVRG